MPPHIPRPLCSQEVLDDQEWHNCLLQNVPREILIRLLRSAAIEYPEFAVRIEAAALASDPPALEAFLLRQIDKLRRRGDGHRFGGAVEA